MDYQDTVKVEMHNRSFANAAKCVRRVYILRRVHFFYLSENRQLVVHPSRVSMV